MDFYDRSSIAQHLEVLLDLDGNVFLLIRRHGEDPKTIDVHLHSFDSLVSKSETIMYRSAQFVHMQVVSGHLL